MSEKLGVPTAEQIEWARETDDLFPPILDRHHHQRRVTIIARRLSERESPDAKGARAAAQTITINGHIREIQNPELSDLTVASRVRMLLRSDLDHESVCTLARDRIVWLHDEVERLRARHCATPAGWLPIESAPKGKPLLGEDGPRIIVIHSDHDGDPLIAYFGIGSGGMGPRWNDTHCLAMSKPTHWMPLPSPPARAVLKQDGEG